MAGSATFFFTDPDEFEAALPEARINLVVTGSGAFRARLTRIQFERLVFLSGEESLARIAHVSLSSQLACLAFPTREAEPMILDGTDVRMGDVLFCGPGQRSHARTAGASHWGSVLFKPDNFTRGRGALPGLVHKPCEPCRVATPARPLIRRLLRLHRRADQVALTAPDLIRCEGIAGELEDVLLEAAIGCLAGERERNTPAPYRSHTDIVNRFEDIAKASPDRLISLSEICAAIGTSDRTLRACCQKYLGVGPNRYLHLLRLNLARRALLSADPAVWTVREICSRYGFDEPGRFAVAYRTLFGESPSVTMHRTRPKSRQ